MCEASKLIQRHVRERKMQTKTLQQTVTFRASPKEVYDMLTDSKKHQSLSGMPAKISKRVGGKFTAWGSHLTGINLVLNPGKKIAKYAPSPDSQRPSESPGI